MLAGAAAAKTSFRIFRLYAATRDPKLTSAEIAPHTLKQDGSFALPSFDRLRRDYELVVTTNTSAGNLASMGVPPGTFFLFSNRYFITYC